MPTKRLPRAQLLRLHAILSEPATSCSRRRGLATISRPVAAGHTKQKPSSVAGAATAAGPTQIRVPHLQASNLEEATQPDHVHEVHRALSQRGILKISLGFADMGSQYLEQLVQSLHRRHGHRLPISHSASRGWFWDVRPSTTSFQTDNHQARSETMKDFAWHTDCSYEDAPPRYFALHVLQHDRFGGGTLMASSTERLSECLSRNARESLTRREFAIAIPPEFVKDPSKKQITASLLASHKQSGSSGLMRFRRDLVTPLTDEAAAALRELDEALAREIGDAARSPQTVRLTAEDFPAGSIILMDNRRWLHARTQVKDPERHLRRVRWDAVPFPGPAVV